MFNVLNNIRKKLFVITILVWIVATVIYAYIYVTSVLAQPNLEGYETEWQFQLLSGVNYLCRFDVNYSGRF